MSSDDDKLEDFDLSAWEAPPPPAELADVVIDRMGGTDVGMAVPPIEDVPREPKRAWLIAGVAAAVVALGFGVWTIVRSTHHAAPSSGGVVAERAQTLSLDTVHADLDPGADVRWARRGGVLHVEQRAGNAVWHVEANEKLVIDAGASLASVQAEGANLRVEVQMNAMDARVIGASALTAAAVAMVSVVVYEGHVSVSRSGQQTVVVAPGSAYQVKSEPEPPVVGSAPIVTGQRIAVLSPELIVVSAGKVDPNATMVANVLGMEMRAIPRAGGGPYLLGPNTDKELVDEKLLMNCENEAPECMAAIGHDLAVDALIYGKVEPVAAGYNVTLKLLDVDRKLVAKVGTWTIPAADTSGDADGIATWAKKMYFDLTGTTATACDAEALKEKGMENINMGQHAAALAQFEASLRCKNDAYVTSLAFMEACSSNNSPKAKQYYKQLSPGQQAKLAQICVRQQVAYEDDDTADVRCDEVSCVLNNYEGTCCDKYRKGQPASAMPEMLGRAEISREINRIKPDIYACATKVQAGGNVKVNVHVQPKGSVTDVTVTEAATPELGSCVATVIAKAHFAATQKGGSFSYPFVIPAPPKTAAAAPANCDAEALKEKGMENVNMGQHAAALAQFEASLKCKNDAYARQLAYMEACNSQNANKARYYFSLLTPDAQAKFEQLCVRNRIDPRNGTTVGDTDTAATQGYLRINSTPSAKIEIDGKDTGLTTPVTGKALRLMPGRHKITLVVGDDRFTYPVVIRAGVTETMSKDLR